MSKCKTVVIGSEYSRNILKSYGAMDFELCFARFQESFVSLASVPVPVNNVLHSLALKTDSFKEGVLFDSCTKDTWNLLIANAPDMVLIDFYADATLGVLEVNGEAYITNQESLYKDNPFFDSLVITDKISVETDFEVYFSIWKKNFDKFMGFMKQFLPHAKVIVNEYQKEPANGVFDTEIQYAAYEKMAEYAKQICKCYTLSEGLRLDDLCHANMRNILSSKYNLIINSDFRSGTLFWKKWNKAYRIEDGILKYSDTTSEDSEWNLLLSNEIEVGENEVLRLSFECKIIDKSIMKDHRIFTIRSWDERHCTEIQNCKDNIAILYKNENSDGNNFYRYEYSFIPRGRIVSVGPEIRQRGIIEYRNIMLTVGLHDKWNSSYIECELVPSGTVLVDVNREELLYKPEKERSRAETERCAINHNDFSTIDDVKKENCYGCGACQNICPSHAIEMRDILGEGFLYPVIDKEKCVSCGLCVKACPSIHRVNDKVINPSAYAVKCESQIAEASSSAGIFYLLAKHILLEGGYICGAVYDEKFNVHHTLTDDRNIVSRMRKSKYVQSNTRNVYAETKYKLEAGDKVLFTGTPCQVAGLLAFLSKEYDNLLTMDVICHGVPSPGMWRKYLDENWEVDKLGNIDFRYRGDKSLYGSQFLKFTFKNGNEYICYKAGDDSYYTHFMINLALRPSCEHCEYAVTPRAADFSAGDWWGAKTLRPDLIDDDKTSLLLVNSKKAYETYQLIHDKFKFELSISLQDAMSNNRSSIRCNISPQRKYFFEQIRKGDTFEGAVRKSMFPQYDVIIVGSALNKNYGAIMTNYALYKAVANAGYKVAFTNYPTETTPERAINFFEKNTELAVPKKNFRDYNWMTDTFLLGSDQLWNYTCFKVHKLRYYLDFAFSNKKRISYAPSYGFDYLTMYGEAQSEYPVANSLMKRFDCISVREHAGVQISQQEYSVAATWVLDPVFLLKSEDYVSLAEEAKRKPYYRYIASYFLIMREQANDIMWYVAEHFKLPMINMTNNDPASFIEEHKDEVIPICEDVSVEEWLYNIQNSEFVVTNSFHCTCFSIILRKNFIVIQKDWALSRLTSLLNMLGLQDRLVGSFEEMKEKEYLLDTPIDYEKVHQILNEKRAESLRWLMDSLKAPKCVTEHLYLDRRGMLPEEAAFEEITHLADYLEKLRNDSEDHVLIACTHGNNFDRERAHSIVRYCMDRLHISEMDYNGTARVNDNLLSDELLSDNLLPDNLLPDGSIHVLAKGNGKKNCRTLGIKLKDCELESFRQNPHYVYSVSFDWNTNASGGSFRMQLGQTPWDSITEDIEVSDRIRGGHYENIYMSSACIAKFESGELQVRTDDLEGELRIDNLKLERGNRPTAKYSSQKDMNGLALICDATERHLDLSVTSIGRLQYQAGGTRILLEYLNQGYRNCKPISELYIDIAGRDIYPMQKEGLYLMLYSKKSQRMIDISRVEDAYNGSLVHM